MATVLVTGGAGFIGSHVARELLALGHSVVLFDSFAQYISPLETHYKLFLRERLDDILDRAILERGDTRDKLTLLGVIQKYKPERIIHLAALPIADLSNRFPDETVSTIVNSTVNILDIVKEVSFAKRFVYISSSMVYGDFRYVPADEEHPTLPKEVYGGTKLAAEVLTRAYGKRFGLPYTIIRPSAVYGPTDMNNRVSQKFIMNAMCGKPLEMHDGGRSRLDFTYVKDIARGICEATFAPGAENETFNITRGEGRSLAEFAEILRVWFPNLEVRARPADMYRPSRGTLDIAKARAAFGYDPKYSLEEGLKEYVAFFQKHAAALSADDGAPAAAAPADQNDAATPHRGRFGPKPLEISNN